MTKKPKAISVGEATFALQCKALKLTPETQFKFCETRRWKSDFAFPAQKLLIEIEGGIWQKSRHTTGTGFTNDCEKYNEAALLGYRVLRFTTDMVKDGKAIETLFAALNIVNHE